MKSKDLVEKLWEKHKERIEQELDTHYGVITFKDDNYHNMGVVKKAKKLHKNKTTPQMLRTIVARMSSELAGLTVAHYSYVKKYYGNWKTNY